MGLQRQRLKRHMTKKAKDYQEPSKTGRSKEASPQSSAYALISDFWLRNCHKNTFLLFEATQLVVICCSSYRKQIYCLKSKFLGEKIWMKLSQLKCKISLMSNHLLPERWVTQNEYGWPLLNGGCLSYLRTWESRTARDAKSHLLHGSSPIIQVPNFMFQTSFFHLHVLLIQHT